MLCLLFVLTIVYNKFDFNMFPVLQRNKKILLSLSTLIVVFISLRLFRISPPYEVSHLANYTKTAFRYIYQNGTNSEEPIQVLSDPVPDTTHVTQNPALDQLPDDMDDEFMRIQTAIQRDRKQHLNSKCRYYNNRKPDSIAAAKSSKEMLVIEKYKIVMCVSAKVGGKSWKRVLNVLAGLSNSTMEGKSFEAVRKARKIKRLSSYSPTQLRKIFRTYNIIMFSRHPLTRTLSAFNNKMSPNATDYRNRGLFWNLGYKDIMQKYRKSVGPFDFNTYDLTFQEFVRYLGDRKTKKSKTNNHWIENSKFCRPCDIPYTVIGRFETMSDDAKYILKLTNASDIVQFPATEGKGGNATDSSKFDSLFSSYEQVLSSDLEKLIERYRHDYVLFNYSIPSLDVRQWHSDDFE